jgi:hypothetical protein
MKLLINKMKHRKSVNNFKKGHGVKTKVFLCVCLFIGTGISIFGQSENDFQYTVSSRLLKKQPPLASYLSLVN